MVLHPGRNLVILDQVQRELGGTLMQFENEQVPVARW